MRRASHSTVSAARSPRASAAVLRAVVAVGLGCGGAGPAGAAPPLDAAERDLARRLAESVPWEAPTPRSRAHRPHPLGIQTLLVEIDERKGAPAGPRRARVYQYDHRGARARRLVVELAPGTGVAGADGRVLERRALAGTHWPLGAAERAWVRERLGAVGWVARALDAERAARGLAPLDGPFGGEVDGVRAPGALRIKASVHEPRDPDDPCARERCALVSLFDADGTVSTVEPVVRFADATMRPRAGTAR